MTTQQPMDRQTFEKKEKQFAKTTGPMCRGCGLIWFFDEPQYLVCTTCAKPQSKPKPEEFTDA
jgi:hypothetical protein